jgi:hypothetical protein
MKAPPEVLPPSAIVAVRDWLSAGDWPVQSDPQRIIDGLANHWAWEQLSKHHKPIITRARLIKLRYMEMGEEMPDDKKWSDKDIAQQVVFLNSFFFAISEMQTTTAAKEKRQTDSFRKQARYFRKTAYLLRQIGFVREAEAVERVAAWCEEKADETISLDKRLIVPRVQQSRSRARAFCMQLSKITRLLYGNALYEIVAGLAREVTGTFVTKWNARYWSGGGCK